MLRTTLIFCFLSCFSYPIHAEENPQPIKAQFLSEWIGTKHVFNRIYEFYNYDENSALSPLNFIFSDGAIQSLRGTLTGPLDYEHLTIRWRLPRQRTLTRAFLNRTDGTIISAPCIDGRHFRKVNEDFIYFTRNATDSSATILSRFDIRERSCQELARINNFSSYVATSNTYVVRSGLWPAEYKTKGVCYFGDQRKISTLSRRNRFFQSKGGNLLMTSKEIRDGMPTSILSLIDFSCSENGVEIVNRKTVNFEAGYTGFSEDLDNYYLWSYDESPHSDDKRLAMVKRDLSKIRYIEELSGRIYSYPDTYINLEVEVEDKHLMYKIINKSTFELHEGRVSWEGDYIGHGFNPDGLLVLYSFHGIINETWVYHFNPRNRSMERVKILEGYIQFPRPESTVKTYKVGADHRG